MIENEQFLGAPKGYFKGTGGFFSLSRNGNVLIPNLKAHECAGINPVEYTERINQVKCLRTTNVIPIFTLFVTSQEEKHDNLWLWEYVNNGNFSYDHIERWGRVFHIIELPFWLFELLIKVPKEKINAIIIYYLLIEYIQSDNKPAMEKQILPEYKDDLLKVYEEYNLSRFSSKNIKRFILNAGIGFLRANGIGTGEVVDYFPAYLNDVGHKVWSRWCHHYGVNRLGTCYLNDSDFDRIIINKNHDELRRCEGDKDSMDIWKVKYKAYHNILN